MPFVSLRTSASTDLGIHTGLSNQTPTDMEGPLYLIFIKILSIKYYAYMMYQDSIQLLLHSAKGWTNL